MNPKIHPPAIIKKLFPAFIFNFPKQKNTIFITIDDGPIPEMTPLTLEILKKYNAKATFFCVGDNIRKYPEISQQILNHGHSIGNHTFSHLNGWKTENNK